MEYDVVIVGGGITGTSAAYVLSNYTNIKKIALIEKYDELATGVSNNKNNSQTLHVGDVETHYSVEKAKKVKEGAMLLARYAEKHKKEKLFRKTQRMALAVGKKECKDLKKHYNDFKKLFPDSKLIGREDLSEIEPLVVEGRDPDVELLAMYTPEGYVMDYGAVAKSFARHSKANIIKGEKIKNIEREKGKFIVKGSKEYKAKAVLVAVGSYSLHFAHSMGYGKELIVLPVAGRFLLVDKKLNGKVYMMQDPNLPFSSAHADPDVNKPNEIRIGPIAKVLPMLESRNYRSILDFFRMFKLNWNAIVTIVKTLSDPIYIKYMFRQVSYSLPVIGKRIYLKEARKIIPSLEADDIKVANEYGGIRPQLMNIKTRKVEFGAGKIKGDNIIFDVTPSPGASMALDNAYKNTKEVMPFFPKAKFNEKKFLKDFDF